LSRGGRRTRLRAGALRAMADSPAPVLFVHVPKTGGTSVTNMLKKAGVPLLDKVGPGGEWSPFKDGKVTCNARHTPPRRRRSGVPDGSSAATRLAVVRQPYDRLVSEYRFECWANKRRLARLMGMTERQLGPMTVCQRNDTLLNAFLRRAMPLEYSYERLNGQSETDCHLLCQSEFLDASDVQVLCFEKEMTPAVSAFLRNHTSAAYGVAGPLGAGDLAAFKRESSPNYVPGLKHSAASRLETETLRMVNRLCPQDFNVCGYAATRRDTQGKAAPHTPRPERSAIAARRRWRTEGKKGGKKAGGGGKGGGTAHGHWQAQRAMSGGDEPPPPPPPPCRDLSCTTRLGSFEPPWVNLSFQPRIDWNRGGVRGDCVVGEYNYIMPAFCEPPGRGGGQRRTGVPSEERLEAADIHSLGLAQAGLAELAMQLPNRTFMLQGDSVMEQFYNALQCFARKEELELPLPAAFEADLERQRPLWMVGKRKMAPKLPVQTRGGMRMLFSRAIKYESEDLTAAMATSNVLVINWGLHYHKMDQYREDATPCLCRLESRLRMILVVSLTGLARGLLPAQRARRQAGQRGPLPRDGGAALQDERQARLWRSRRVGEARQEHRRPLLLRTDRGLWRQSAEWSAARGARHGPLPACPHPALLRSDAAALALAFWQLHPPTRSVELRHLLRLHALLLLAGDVARAPPRPCLGH